MATFTPKKATSFLTHSHSGLEAILTKVDHLQILESHILPYLDASIAKATQVGNLINQRLVLIVTNGSVATQLRYQVPDLIQEFKSHSALCHIKDIELKVRPKVTPSSNALHTGQPMSPLSKKTADIVKEIAESIEDTKIRSALLKIAKNDK